MADRRFRPAGDAAVICGGKVPVEVVGQVRLTVQQNGVECKLGEDMCDEEAADADADEPCPGDDLSDTGLCFQKGPGLVERRVRQQMGPHARSERLFHYGVWRGGECRETQARVRGGKRKQVRQGGADGVGGPNFGRSQEAGRQQVMGEKIHRDKRRGRDVSPPTTEATGR